MRLINHLLSCNLLQFQYLSIHYLFEVYLLEGWIPKAFFVCLKDC